MITITDVKEVHAEFKYFKNIYTKINISDKIQFKGNDTENCVDMVFIRDSKFSNLIGRLSGDTYFLSWLKESNKIVELTLEDINLIQKTLKKNVIKIEYDERYFSFNFKDKEENEHEIIVEVLDRGISFNVINFKNELEIPASYLASDIVQVFNNNGEISETRTKDKIIEIPRDRINSIIKDTPLRIKFTEKTIDGSRYVSLSSKNDILGLQLEEIFKTI